MWRWLQSDAATADPAAHMESIMLEPTSLEPGGYDTFLIFYEQKNMHPTTSAKHLFQTGAAATTTVTTVTTTTTATTTDPWARPEASSSQNLEANPAMA
eukprot:4740005-Pyramimonas_sp.AAC.1